MSETASSRAGDAYRDSRPSALDVVRTYHERTKHRIGKYAAHPDTLDWDARPAPFRRFDGADALPLPRLSDLGGPLRRALERPVTEPVGAEPLPLSLDGLSAFFALSLGVTAWKREGPDRWAVRANPSSGNLHPVEAYVLASGVACLASGVHHYRALDHALEQRALWGGVPPSRPRLWVALTTIMWREAWKYGERAFRYCQLDTGHAVAALRYAAGVLGWRIREQEAVGSEALRRALGLDRAEDRAPTRRAETELEEAELLLELEPGPSTPGLLGPELERLATAARFSGRASAIDPHPMYCWPVLQEVAAATRQADSPAPAATSESPPTRIRSSIARAAAASLMLGRRSAQRFDRDFVLPHAAFAEMLRGVALSAQAPASLDLALFVHRVEGLAPGAYLFPLASADPNSCLRQRLARQFSLRQVSGFDFDGLAPLLELATLSPRELARTARTLHCHQEIASSCCYALGMLADLEKALDAPAGYRRLLREAGSLGQTLYLQAEAALVRGTGIGCFFDDEVADFLGLRDSTVRSIYHFSVGRPIEDPRIETELQLFGDGPLSGQNS
jgi:nitroreductase